MKPKRKRLNLTLDHLTARKVAALSRRMGFRSPSAMGAACISAVVGLCEGVAAEEPGDGEAVRQLFEEMAQWQRSNGSRHDINQRL